MVDGPADGAAEADAAPEAPEPPLMLPRGLRRKFCGGDTMCAFGIPKPGGADAEGVDGKGGGEDETFEVNIVQRLNNLRHLP